jgi:hypothetical protein
MSAIEDVVSELESIGAIGDTVVLLKQPLKTVDEDRAEEPPKAPKPVDAALRAKLEALSIEADEKLAAVIEAVQDLRGVFQRLNEATTGDPDAAISEEA